MISKVKSYKINIQNSALCSCIHSKQLENKIFKQFMIATKTKIFSIKLNQRYVKTSTLKTTKCHQGKFKNLNKWRDIQDSWARRFKCCYYDNSPPN